MKTASVCARPAQQSRSRHQRACQAMLLSAALGVLAGPASGQEDSWGSRAPMPTPRRLLAAAVVKDKIYTFGGCGSPCFDPPLHTDTFEETRVEVYDPGDPSHPTNPRPEAWSVDPKPIPAILFGAAAAAPGNGKIYLFGGFVTGNAVYEYTPGRAEGSWARKASMPAPRHGLAAVALDGKIYVLGGSTGSAASNALEVYDPEKDSWRQAAPMPTARVFLAAAAVNGKIYAIGGSPDCCGEGRTDAVEVYDTATNTWRSAARLPVALQVSAAAALGGKIYVFGGFIRGEGVQGMTHEYDPEANRWTTKTSMPVPRDQAPAVVLDNRIHILGGSVDCHCRPLGDHDAYTPPVAEPCAVSITKTDGDGRTTAAPGDTLLYEIAVSSSCPAAVSVTVTDDLRATGLQNVRWCRGAACTPSLAGNLMDTATVPANGTVTYRATGTAPCACNRAQISNRACVTVSGQPNCTPPVIDSIVPAPGADLALSITGPNDIRDCQAALYTFNVSNAGPCTARDVVLDRTAGGFELVSISQPCKDTLPCELGDLAPRSEVRFLAALKVPASLQCPTTVSTSFSLGSRCDPVAANSQSTLQSVVPCDLAITKTDGLATAAPGDPILYTIEVANQSCGAVSGAQVKDLFPPQLEQVRWCRGRECLPSRAENPLEDRLDLAFEGKEIYRAAGTVSLLFTGTLSNTASVLPPSGAPPDPTPEDATATDTTEIVPKPGLAAACDISGSSFEGETITKTFVLRNGGPAVQGDNPGDEFVDVLPPGLTLVGATASSGTVTTGGNSVSWNGAIPVAGTVTLEITATIDPGTLGKRICNEATVFFDADADGTNESSLTGDPCCLDVLPLAPIPVLSAPALAALVLLLAALAVARLRRACAG